MSDRPDVLVIGGGPGGYTAAFRAADLGLRTVVVERDETLGGVCLNVGCIPSKALLHAASIVNEVAHAREIGIDLGTPSIDLPRLRASTAKVVSTLTGGLAGLARKRGVRVVRGSATFASPSRVSVTSGDGDVVETLEFATAIVATGSRPIGLPGLPDDPRIIDSTGALALAEVPKRLLVIGGGIIGLEMATVYDALGSDVTVVEALGQLIPGCDPDLVKPLATRIGGRYRGVYVDTKVTSVEAGPSLLVAHLDGEDAPDTVEVDRVLVSIGRRANGDLIGAQNAGLDVDDRGVIHVDERMRTNVEGILAIGDVTGNPMLAHRAAHQGTVAAEVAAGLDAQFDAQTVPSVAYTDPEIAWMGLTETQAKADGTPYEVAAIPWAASGRALTLGRTEGRTKLLVDPDTHRVLGGGIVGVNAGEMIAELVLALEMGAVSEDLSLAIHAHPTLSETSGLAAEWSEGTITDLLRKG